MIFKQLLFALLERIASNVTESLISTFEQFVDDLRKKANSTDNKFDDIFVDILELILHIVKDNRKKNGIR